MASDDSVVHASPPPPPPPNRFLNFNDPTNPFRLDHGDNPSVSLVPDLFTIDNYTTWSHAMQCALRAKNKLGFINDELTQPTTPSDPLLQPWERCNDMIMLLDPLPSVGKVFSLIQQQEHQHLMLNNNPSLDSMALAVKKFYPTSKPPNKSGHTQKPRPYCTHYHLFGHTLENCFKAGNAEPSTCTHCHMSGHVAEKCYKLHGYPLGHELFNKAKSSLVFANSASAEPDEDSSATVALTKDQYHQLLSLL
ncbi:hypothetical protein F0562_012154 [Nyssa sinensis]|uniref:Retrotransposon Copia-like N-terminal domain-containing protein n=1 Tax=Nyssa sinensis TaxID=561372 RepID=A0A5J4ZWJ9_9ASTE|nr:hypothetical protein F0562_012154 [Nyssa sinensis]